MPGAAQGAHRLGRVVHVVIDAHHALVLGLGAGVDEVHQVEERLRDREVHPCFLRIGGGSVSLTSAIEIAGSSRMKSRKYMPNHANEPARIAPSVHDIL